MPVIKTCRHCGEEFQCKPSHVMKKTYCSRACMAEDYRARFAGDANPNYRAAGEKVCARCGISFQDYGNKRFCSLECYWESDERKASDNETSKRQRKPDHPCKSCGKTIPHKRVYCGECDPNRKRRRVGHCLNCGEVVPSSYDVQFCRPCRSTGVHKVEVFSICSRCGAKVPNKRYRKYCDSCWEIRMVRGRKVDENQPEIIEALEAVGAEVLDLSGVGGGCPDLLISFRGELELLEVKNPETKGKLNERQRKWHKEWRGRPPHVVYTVDEALKAIGAI